MTSTSTDRRFGVNGSLPVKAPCKVATTANITLSGEQTIDGVAIVSGNRVLVKDQTDGIENGVYAANTSAWAREPDWDGARDVVEGTYVYATSGSTNSGHWRVTTSDPIIPGTTDTNFVAATTDSTLRGDLDTTDLDNTDDGFHLVNYPPLTGETGVTDYEYGWGNVKRYGATGDGTTDDTTSFQNAIDSAAAIYAHAASIYIPSGRYVISTTITVTGGVSIIGEAANSTRIVVERPFSGNVFENDTQGSYWRVSDIYGVHDVEASDSLSNGAFLYAKGVEFVEWDNIVAQMHGLTAIGLHIDTPASGQKGLFKIKNPVITGTGLTGPYDGSWNATAKSCRVAGIKLGAGIKNAVITDPFVESSYDGILFEGTSSQINHHNVVIGGTLNTCDNCMSFRGYAQENTVMGTETIGYPNNLFAEDTNNCKQNIAYNVRCFGDTGFDTFIKRNIYEFASGSPTLPLKKIFGGVRIENDTNSLELNRVDSDGVLAAFDRAGTTVAELSVTSTILSLLHAATNGSVVISGGNSSANGGNIILGGATGDNNIQLRISGDKGIEIDSNRHILPGSDADQNLGSSILRYAQLYTGSLTMTDGIAAPSTQTGYAQLYVDTADGDLKVKFGDGTVKTIVVDT